MHSNGAFLDNTDLSNNIWLEWNTFVPQQRVSKLLNPCWKNNRTNATYWPIMALQQPSNFWHPGDQHCCMIKERHRNQWPSLAIYLPSFCSGKEWIVCPSCSSVWWMSSVFENPSNETSVLTCVSYCPAAQGGFPCATNCSPSISHWQWLLRDGSMFRNLSKLPFWKAF